MSAVRLATLLLFGLIVGGVTFLVAPGRAPRGWLASMLVGAAGSMVGAVFASAFAWNTGRKGYVASLVAAGIWVGLYRFVRHRVEDASSRGGGGTTASRPRDDRSLTASEPTEAAT